MTVYFVGSGPGDPELLTRKALRLLQNAKSCIYAGSLVDPVLLEELPSHCERHDSARMNLEEIVAVMKSAQQRNMDVIRLHSGEPSLYGAIGEQMRKLETLQIPFEIVPGISSFQAAAASLKVELTCPEISQTVVLTRSPGRTPLPGEDTWLHQFHPHATYCVFLSVDKFPTLAPHIGERMGNHCPCAVVFHASRPDQKILRGTLETIGNLILQAKIQSTAQILIGYAIDPPFLHESKLYDAQFHHGFRGANG